MVSVEELPLENESGISRNDAKNEGPNEAVTDEPDEWKELMGKDILIKVNILLIILCNESKSY